MSILAKTHAHCKIPASGFTCTCPLLYIPKQVPLDRKQLKASNLASRTNRQNTQLQATGQPLTNITVMFVSHKSTPGPGKADSTSIFTLAHFDLSNQSPPQPAGCRSLCCYFPITLQPSTREQCAATEHMHENSVWPLSCWHIVLLLP
jgi:hypothetical protein